MTSAFVEVLIIFAESEAKYLDPLFATERLVVLDAFAVSGEAADGLEVEMVSERFVRVPA